MKIFVHCHRCKQVRPWREPLLAAIYVQRCVRLGISPLTVIAIVGTAGALDDAGSPVSESVSGPAAGLDADERHDHIYGSTIPAFLHCDLPLLAAGWIAGMVLQLPKKLLF